MTVRRLLVVAALSQATLLARPLVGVFLFFASRARLEEQRASILAAIDDLAVL